MKTLRLDSMPSLFPPGETAKGQHTSGPARGAPQHLGDSRPGRVRPAVRLSVAGAGGGSFGCSAGPPGALRAGADAAVGDMSGRLAYAEFVPRVVNLKRLIEVWTTGEQNARVF